MRIKTLDDAFNRIHRTLFQLRVSGCPGLHGFHMQSLSLSLTHCTSLHRVLYNHMLSSSLTFSSSLYLLAQWVTDPMSYTHLHHHLTLTHTSTTSHLHALPPPHSLSWNSLCSHPYIEALCSQRCRLSCQAHTVHFCSSLFWSQSTGTRQNLIFNSSSPKIPQVCPDRT